MHKLCLVGISVLSFSLFVPVPFYLRGRGDHFYPFSRDTTQECPHISVIQPEHFSSVTVIFNETKRDKMHLNIFYLFVLSFVICQRLRREQIFRLGSPLYGACHPLMFWKKIIPPTPPPHFTAFTFTSPLYIAMGVKIVF